jgi:glycosyltransferase involved in cell wall biosynthesis
MPLPDAPAAAIGAPGVARLPPRRVLIITPHFPPDSSAAAHRVRVLAPHLPAAGWEPTVLTLAREAYEGRLDPSLESLVPSSLRIVRVPAWPARVTRLVGLGDLGLRGFESLFRASASLLARERFDAVFVTIYPTYPALLGPLLKRRFGVPFVLDYQDPWVGEWGRTVGGGPNGSPDWKSRASRRIAEWLEPFAVRSADGVTAVSRATYEAPLDRVRRAAPIVCAEIPLGADPADVLFLRSHPRVNRWFRQDDGAVHVCSAGTILPRATETVRAVMAAIARLRHVAPAPFRFHFFGTSNQWGDQPPRVRPLAEQAGAAGCVEEHPGRLDYLDALQVLADADVNLVLGSDEPHYTASRLYPALMAGHPVVAVVHRESSVVRTIEASGAPHRAVAFDSNLPAGAHVDAIAEALLNAAHRARAEHPHARPGSRDCDRLDAAEWSGPTLAKALARVLDAVVSR